jgi:hypothetical protein
LQIAKPAAAAAPNNPSVTGPMPKNLNAASAPRALTKPFAPDDIMETFDHFRSEEVFRLFGEMASAAQVIYLMRHQHLCEIAKTVVPGVTIHGLG